MLHILNVVLLFILFSLLNVQSLYSQQENEIENTFNKYIQAIENKDIEAMMDMMYHKIFETIPRETLTELSKQTYEDTLVNVTIQNSIIDSISSKTIIEETQYSIISYSYLFTMEFLGENDFNEDFYSFTVDPMISIHGEENVTFNEKEAKILVNIANRAIAIKEKEDWKFIEYKANLEPILQKFIPAEVLLAAKPIPKACSECTSFEDALIQPGKVTSLIINGSMGENMAIIPVEIGELTNLKILYLSDHSLNILPKEISKLKNLEELSLAGCQLENLPDELFTLKSLKEIILFDNSFSNKYFKKLKKKFKKEMPNTKVLLESDF